MELETHKALVVDQRMQLSMLTQKLTVTTELLDQKEQELKTLREKLMYDVEKIFTQWHTHSELLSLYLIVHRLNNVWN